MFDTDENPHPSSIAVGNAKEMFVLQHDFLRNAHFTLVVIVSGDFNENHQSDMVVGYNNVDNVDIFISYDIGSFRLDDFFTTSSNPSSAHLNNDTYIWISSLLVMDDFNDNQHVDIVVANYAADNVSVLRGYGNRLFQDEMTFSTGVASGPYNVGVLRGHGNGSFAEIMTFLTDFHSRPFCLAVGDLNSDK